MDGVVGWSLAMPSFLTTFGSAGLNLREPTARPVHEGVTMTCSTRQRIGVSRVTAAAWGSLVFLGSGAIGAQEPGRSFQLSPGVVVDPARSQVYVMAPDQEIVARNIEGGAEAWRSKGASKPLAVADNLVVGQAERAEDPQRLKIVTLDPESNGRPVAGYAIALPAGVAPSVSPTPRSSFVAAARPTDGEVEISWEFAERRKSGVRPGSQESYFGGAPAASAGSAPAVAPASPAAGAPAPGSPQTLNQTFRLNLRSGAVQPAVPVPPAPRVAPAAAAAPSGEPQVVSADGRHILSSRRIADDPVWEKYLWTIYDRATSKQVGEIKAHSSLAPFFVSGSRLVYEVRPATPPGGTAQPLRLVAVDLDTGNMVWTQPIRDTESGERPG